MTTTTAKQIYDELEQSLSHASPLTFNDRTDADHNFEIQLIAEALYQQRVAKDTLEDPILQIQNEAQRKSYENQYQTAWNRIVWCQEKRIGKIWIHADPDGIILVDLAFSLKFQRIGYGTLVVSKLTHLCDQLHLPLRLSVERRNRPAFNLYQKFRLQVAEETNTHYAMIYSPD